MGLFGLFESRASIESPSTKLGFETLAELLLGPELDAGVSVTQTSALKMSAVWRATSVISGLCGALPLHAYAEGTKDRVVSTVIDDPHPDLTPLEWRRLSGVHRCLWGNFYAQKVRTRAGQVAELWPMNPARVTPGRAHPIPENPSGKVFAVRADSGETLGWTPREVFHVPGMGYDGVAGLSPITHAAQGIGLALAAERYGAKLFGSGNLLSGFLRTAQRLDEKQANALQGQWKTKMSGLGTAHEVGVLDSGADFQSLTMPSDDAEMLQSRHFQVSEVARYFGVPAFLMGETEKSTSWGTGLEQQMTGFVVIDLGPTWLGPTEQRATKELLPRGQYAKYQVNGLLRGDSQARAEFYRTLRELGVFNADDIAALEDMPPLPNGLGQVYLQPMNFAPLGTRPAVTNGGTGDAQ